MYDAVRISTLVKHMYDAVRQDVMYWQSDLNAAEAAAAANQRGRKGVSFHVSK